MTTQRQDDIFRASEGDAWFQRNRSALAVRDMENDFPLRLLALYNIKPQKALEIGAANGYRLSALREKFGADVTGVEASAEAVADGAQRFPGVRMLHGVATDVPLRETFDLIVVNFVLHWIDRANLLHVMNEIDRLLDDGGYLLIGDFLPDMPKRVPYHHLPGQEVYTYKQDYPAAFAATNMYRIVARMTGDSHSGKFTGEVSDRDRTVVALLRKDIHGLYQM